MDRILSPRKALNKAFLKVKPNRSQIENFKTGLIGLIDHINEKESEEFHKNLVSRFLHTIYYGERFFINTKEREDLAIYNGKDAKSSVGVIVEAKKPSNRNEMISLQNINAKALHELVLYYLRERITGNNLEIKQLVATNIYEWFIFDATIFEKCFASDKALVKQFADFEEKRLSGTDTDFFYKKIAAPAVEKYKDEISFTHFDLRIIEKPLRDSNPENDSKLIPFFKIFSPEHLLKLPFANDSNSLDRSFYNELLHIIGLEETKTGSKKVIGRKAVGKRDAGSLIENAISILSSEDCLANVKRSEYGSTRDEQLFNVALELAITWINRVLFLKLLEGQLVKYHKGDKNYRFLNSSLIHDYDALNKLFFQVLAVRENERNDLIKQKFGNIPYLNSSLFETSVLEQKTIRVSNLEDEYLLLVLSNTVLTDRTGKQVKGEKNALHYLFGFLDAYDFSSEGSEEIQEENKTLINASVLGLIFEKINGYKDGSFFTPGFITMYMARETIRRAVVQKFNESLNLKCNDFGELKEDLFEEMKSGAKSREDFRREANQIVNSLRICDPAVGSGHFLVSALNELITIKSELRILTDRAGQPLTGYTIEIANDELIVTNPDDELFEYHPGNKESQRMQETLFHEKQTLIENCLFGVDINPNSVKICRLRLWIELLKNAYYKTTPSRQTGTPLLAGGEMGPATLETLPNIDINIKTGNSLISRYPLDADIKKALKNSRWSIESYRIAVQTYREAKNKEQKHDLLRLIDMIKNDFESEIARNDKRLLQLNKLRGELFELTNQSQLFAKTKTELAVWDTDVKKKTTAIKKLETELEEIKNNRIYENAFEWRFEFPEVLNNDGDFVGFDVVIGNPPYISNWDLSEANREQVVYLEQEFTPYLAGHWDLFGAFVILANRICLKDGLNTFILPTSFYKEKHSTELRKFFINEVKIIQLVDFKELVVFEDVARQTGIFLVQKMLPKSNLILVKQELNQTGDFIKQDFFKNLKNFAFKTTVNTNDIEIFKKLNSDVNLLGTLVCINTGVVAHSKKESSLNFTKDDVVHKEFLPGYKKYVIGSNLSHYSIIYDNDFLDYESKKEHFHRPKFPLLFESEKIIVRRISGKNNSIIACYDSDGYYSNDNLMHLVRWNNEILEYQRPENKWEIDFNSHISLKYIASILNSSLVRYFFSKFLSTDTLQGSYSSIYPEDLRQIPIRNIDENEQKSFILKVDQILDLKQQNPAADTTALESEIDEMV